ncbi:hypothetical protein NONI108955_01135 [Nocardia ninae]|uniref:Uncharacterized protein n=1 Tax=Nocardia ninae NBRC 108245 TaxID=1210091 RepID=A0A511MCG8_9NOCA|nr:hypothetical protein [Nocardia ninae]GEM38181.1 hypothetical protein NN4_27000 [Nocardia ninae NBRC 108245]
MTSDEPIHECRQGVRCKSRIRDDEGCWHGSGVERPDALCRSCEEAAFASIRQLYDDWLLLEAAKLQPPPKDRAPKVTHSTPYSIPIRLDIDTIQSGIEDETLTWARILTRGDPVPTQRQKCVQKCVTIVAANLGTLVDQPWRRRWRMAPRADGGDELIHVGVDGVDAVLSLSDLHRRAREVLGLNETRIWLPDPCHLCGVKALTSSPDQQTVTCQACRASWAKEEFARLNGVGVLDMKRAS